VSHTVPLGDLSAKMYIYKDDTDSLFFRWNLYLNHMGAPVIQNTETNKTIHLPHLLCYETSCTYAYKNIDHKMIPCQITEFNEAGSVYVVLLTADKSKRMKRGQFRFISAYDLIKLAGSVYDNDGRKQYIVDTSHRSSLLPYDEATVIDAYGGDLHTQDREDASTTGESSESESESENENENESENENENENESDKWSESESESETHNESYEDPAEVSDKQKLKNAYRVLGLEFTDSNPTEQERKLVL
jgi:hypothetical protein